MNKMNKKSICSRVNEHYMLYHGLLGSLSKNELELLPVDWRNLYKIMRKAVGREVWVMFIS